MEHQKLVIADGIIVTRRRDYRNECAHARERSIRRRCTARHDDVHQHANEGLTICRAPRGAHVHDFSGPACGGSPSVVYGGGNFRSRQRRRSEAKRKFLGETTSVARERAIALSRAETRKRAFYVLTLREGASLAQLLPKCFAAAARTGRSAAARRNPGTGAGVTPQAVTAEANLTYEQEARRARCRGQWARRLRFC